LVKDNDPNNCNISFIFRWLTFDLGKWPVAPSKSRKHGGMDSQILISKITYILSLGAASSFEQIVALAQLVRPSVASNSDEGNARFEVLVGLLESDSHLAQRMSAIVNEVLTNSDSKKLFTEVGIASTKSFWADLFAKLNRKFLPEYYPDGDSRLLLRSAFDHRGDYHWLSSIHEYNWLRFFSALQLSSSARFGCKSPAVNQLLDSMLVLSQRIAAIAYEPEIDSKLPDLENESSPFVEIVRSCIRFVRAFRAGDDDYTLAARAQELERIIMDCQMRIVHIYESKDAYGVDMHFIYLIKRLEQQVARFMLLFNVLKPNLDTELHASLYRLLVSLVKAEKEQGSIRKHIHSNLRLMLYKIAVNTSKVGEHYSVASAREYVVMLRAALGGGLIVGLLACLKLGIYYLPLSPFGTALGYSLNYALGFVAIYMLHFTLATKQPAMTASTIAKTLANGESKRVITPDTLLLIRQIARSQFVSLVGNVAASLPFAWLIVYFFTKISGVHMVSAAKSVALMGDVSPWTSLSLLYAAIAGFYLMLSGLVAGYYDNLILHNDLYHRLKVHKGLLKLLGDKKVECLASYLQRNTGNIAGNVALGFLLGATSTVGVFLGLPLDIRHVTFAAANFGMALAGYPGDVPSLLLLQVGVGVFLIGLANVLVSFGLSIAIALYSHGANPSEYVRLIGVIIKDFARAPHQYLFPLRSRKVDL